MADVPVERPETLLAIAVDVRGEHVAGLLCGLTQADRINIIVTKRAFWYKRFI
jgi:hypothetical protein